VHATPNTDRSRPVTAHPQVREGLEPGSAVYKSGAMRSPCCPTHPYRAHTSAPTGPPALFAAKNDFCYPERLCLGHFIQPRADSNMLLFADSTG
jgi:hypothetical protein